MRDLKKRIKKKEESLNQKQEEFTRLSITSAQKSKLPFKNNLKSTKKEINSLRNDKLALEECELDCKRELKKLTKSIRNMKKRNKVESKEVKVLEKEVGKITEKCNDQFERHSIVENSVVKLKTYLKKEKENKDKFLQEVNIQKRAVGNNRYRNTDTKTINPVDWDKIENEATSTISNAKYSWVNEKSLEKTKARRSLNESEDQAEISFMSFDPD